MTAFISMMKNMVQECQIHNQIYKGVISIAYFLSIFVYPILFLEIYEANTFTQLAKIAQVTVEVEL